MSIPTRKIIHVDMDCFYAAIEIRDNPSLADKPIAVGGSSDRRGVLCTCNYIAREYGVRSAMATATAYRLCKDLIVLPVDMPKYRQVAKQIHAIFREYTDLVEPLALDEAYLDVTGTDNATLIAQAIRKRIWQTQNLTASAGVAPNKFLAKIASGWQKPNGLFVIRPNEVENFVKTLSVTEIYGVGKVTAEKLQRMGLNTCVDLQRLSFAELADRFGKLGERLYDQCRGIDRRPVEPNRIRKSLSVEQTFPRDIPHIDDCIDIVTELFQELIIRIQQNAENRAIKNQYIKIKFNNFKLSTSEVAITEINFNKYIELFRQSFDQEKAPFRLLGLGVHFATEDSNKNLSQQNLF